MNVCYFLKLPMTSNFIIKPFCLLQEAGGISLVLAALPSISSHLPMFRGDPLTMRLPCLPLQPSTGLTALICLDKCFSLPSAAQWTLFLKTSILAERRGLLYSSTRYFWSFCSFYWLTAKFYALWILRTIFHLTHTCRLLNMQKLSISAQAREDVFKKTLTAVRTAQL